jgi:hypothetical protein
MTKIKRPVLWNAQNIDETIYKCSIHKLGISCILPFLIRSHLKNRILVQSQGGSEIQPAGILKYSEELKGGPNTEIGPKDIFEIASDLMLFPLSTVRRRI